MTSLPTKTPPTRARLPTWRELVAQENELREILRRRLAAKMMSPNLRSERVIASPCVTPIINGDVARVVKLASGRCRIEWWVKGTGWTAAPDGAFSLDEFMPGACRPVSVRDRARLGMPIAEF